MIEGFALRTWLSAVIAVAMATVVYFYARDAQLALVVLVGGAASAVITATIGDSEPMAPAPEQPTVAAPPPEPLAVVDAIDEPILLLRDARVAHANAAARRLLGEHILGEDVRTAIRHPAAAEYLSAPVPGRDAQPIDLVGLGAQEQRWRMRATDLPDGVRVVHLADQTGSHAAEKMRVDFVANASHELRTPLASILGYVETLADDAGDDPAIRRRFLGIVFDEARRMERLVEDLMSLSRIEAEKFRLPAASVDLAALTREVHDVLVDNHGDRGRDIVLNLADDVPPVAGDRIQLSQVLHNLIGNAMKYGRAGTPVTVSLGMRNRDTIQLAVTDEGEGIAPEHLPRLTERFYRVDAGRSRSLGGTGLGLAIVKHIVERHRGRLDIASKAGEGTRVTVTLRPAVSLS